MDIKCCICLDFINEKEDSYWKCSSCDKYIHYECLENDVCNCPICHNQFNMFDAYLTLNQIDYKHWIKQLHDYKCDVVNEKIDFLSNLINGYVSIMKKVKVKEINNYKNVMHELESIKSLQAYSEEIKHLKSEYDELSDLHPYLYGKYNKAYFDNYEPDMSLDSMATHILKDLPTSIGTFNNVHRYVEFLVNEWKVTENLGYHSTFQFGYETEIKKIEFYKMALRNRWIIDFVDGIKIFPDEEGLKLVNEIESILQEEFSDIYELIERVPTVVYESYTSFHDRFNIENSVYNDVAHLLINVKDIVIKHPINICSKCKGVVDENYKCAMCQTKYCSECMSELIDVHICLPDEINGWKFILKSTKPCPLCGARIEKKDGCNQMFCTNCHHGFEWNTGRVIEGGFHNPERNNWLKSINKSSDHLSPTFRQYSIEDQFMFFKEIYTTVEHKFHSFYDLFELPRTLVKRNFKLSVPNMKVILNGTYKTPLKKDNFHAKLFMDEWSWLITELLITVGDMLEYLTPFTGHGNNQEFEYILQHANELINAYKHAIDITSGFIESASHDDMYYYDLLALKASTFNCLREFLLLTKVKPPNVSISNETYEALLNKINFDIKIKIPIQIDVSNNRLYNKVDYEQVNALFHMCKTDQDRRLSLPVNTDPLIPKADGPLIDLINKKIKEHYTQFDINEISKYEICFKTHYFVLSNDRTGCYYVKSGKNIKLFKSDLNNTWIRFTMNGKAYKLQITTPID